METGLTKQRIVAELTRSTHAGKDASKLEAYLPVLTEAVRQDGEFVAHLIAWNQLKGTVRDSQVALPVGSLLPGFAYAENSLAHMALLSPRELVKVVQFAKTRAVGYQLAIGKLVERYLRTREGNFVQWERAAVQHRASLKFLYTMFHIKPAPFADAILFKSFRAPGSVFEAIANLKDMPTLEAAGAIVQHRIPYLVVVSALGKRLQETDLVLAMIERMSPAELVTNTKLLERLGVKTDPALRAAFEEGLKRVASEKKVSLKATRAAEAMTDAGLKAKLIGAQERQLKALGGIDGNWLVLGDKSPSMAESVEVARVIASTLAKLVKGEVQLIFFDDGPRYVPVTGKTYDEVKALTKTIKAGGSGTSIGCGVQYALDKGWDISGIALITDGGENRAPMFWTAHSNLCKQLDREVPVYLYLLSGTSQDVLMAQAASLGKEVQLFDLRGKEVDYYALPNLAQTMRASRYSLTDEIMAVPLLTLNEVFQEEVHRAVA